MVNKKSKKKKYQSIYISNNSLGLTEWIPDVYSEYHSYRTHSWYDYQSLTNSDVKINKYEILYQLFLKNHINNK